VDVLDIHQNRTMEVVIKTGELVFGGQLCTFMDLDEIPVISHKVVLRNSKQQTLQQVFS